MRLIPPTEICFVSKTFAVIRQTQKSILKSINSTLTELFALFIFLFFTRFTKYSVILKCVQRYKIICIYKASSSAIYIKKIKSGSNSDLFITFAPWNKNIFEIII